MQRNIASYLIMFKIQLGQIPCS